MCLLVFVPMYIDSEMNDCIIDFVGKYIYTRASVKAEIHGKMH